MTREMASAAFCLSVDLAEEAHRLNKRLAEIAHENTEEAEHESSRLGREAAALVKAADALHALERIYS